MRAASRLLVLARQLGPIGVASASPASQSRGSTGRDGDTCRFLILVCLSHAGNLYGLALRTAFQHVRRFEQCPSTLQRALLNTTNDATLLAAYLARLEPSLRYTLHGHVLARHLPDHVAAAAASARQRQVGVILHWSGHAEVRHGKLHLCAASRPGSTDAELVPVSLLLRPFQPQQPVLLLLDCCYSGAAAASVAASHASAMLLASSAADQVSGGWVMDGSDSGGIFTSFLRDPIGTLFKARWNVFFDLPAKHADQLLAVYYPLAKRLLATALSPDDLHRIKSAGPHVHRLFLHFLLLVRYGKTLYHPQSAVSVPCVASVADAADDWRAFEAEFEQRALDTYQSYYAERRSLG